MVGEVRICMCWLVMGKRFVKFRRFSKVVEVDRFCMCCLVMIGNRIIWFMRLAKRKGAVKVEKCWQARKDEGLLLIPSSTWTKIQTQQLIKRKMYYLTHNLQANVENMAPS